MREFREYGSARGALSNERPYRDPDRDKLFAFIDEFRGAGSSGAVTVYAMESATNREEQAFDELGVKLSLLS